jgi:ubiquinone/menaquinone biosynthesis C-methylase UbiE
MKISKIEKRFVNSKRHAQKNLELIERLFNRIDISNTTRVLEIGCGVGIVSAHLNNTYNMNVVGTDLDSEQIEIAKMYNKESGNLKFMEADSTKLPFGDREFDMVLSIFVMHHIGNWEKALEEINRVLKQKGYFIFYDLVYSKFATRIFCPFAKNYGIYTIDDITNCLKINKFNIVHSEEPRGVIMKNYSMVFGKTG